MNQREPRLAPSLFDGERLTLGRVYRGLRKVDLAHAIGVTPAAISQYEQGRTRPSAAALAALSLHLGFPPAFFERGRPLSHVPEGQAHFRRLRSTSKMDRDRLLARVSFLAEVLAVLEQHVVLPPVAIPDIPGVGDDGHVAERAAAQVRKLWGLGQGPIDHVVRLLETKGVVVVRPNVEAREVDAFSTGITVRPIVVLASDKHDAARSRMDAAHELGHLVMHHDAEPGRQSIEREAKRFAAAFLLPAEPLLRELPRRRLHWDAYFDLKARWRVSIQALLYRARTLGALSPDSYQRAQVQLSARGWRQHEPVDLGAPEEPQLLQRALRLLASQREMTAAQVAASIHIYEDDFESLLADVGPPISPPPAPALKVIGVDEVGG